MQGKVECSVDNWECCGSNVWILFVKSLTKVALIISNFTVERTEISSGVNFRPRVSLYLNGAGIVLHLDHALGYDVQITITQYYFMNNNLH